MKLYGTVEVVTKTVPEALNTWCIHNLWLSTSWLLCSSTGAHAESFRQHSNVEALASVLYNKWLKCKLCERSPRHLNDLSLTNSYSLLFDMLNFIINACLSQVQLQIKILLCSYAFPNYLSIICVACLKYTLLLFLVSKHDIFSLSQEPQFDL